MSESDIAELCRKIYQQHRQAIDLIYEHRPDLRPDLEEFIQQLLQETGPTANIEPDKSERRWIRLAPTEWDGLAFQSTCNSAWSEKQRLLLLEFWNDPQSLQLRITIGPGKLETKEAIYQTLKTLNVAGIRRIKIKASDYSQVGIVPVLSATDYENGDLEELQEKIKAFWLNYIQGDLQVIRTAIYEAFQY